MKLKEYQQRKSEPTQNIKSAKGDKYGKGKYVFTFESAIEEDPTDKMRDAFQMLFWIEML